MTRDNLSIVASVQKVALEHFDLATMDRLILHAERASDEAILLGLRVAREIKTERQS